MIQYAIAVNLLAFFAMGLDKYKARRHRFRIASGRFGCWRGWVELSELWRACIRFAIKRAIACFDTACRCWQRRSSLFIGCG